MVLDIFAIIILLISCYVGYRNGGAKTIVSLLGTVLAFSVATFLGDILSGLIYDSFISQSVVDGVSTYAASTQTVSVAPTVDSLPSFVQSIVDFTGFESNSSLINAVNSAKDTVALSVESAIRPLVVSVLSFIITTVLFFIVHFIIRLVLLKPIIAVFRLPLIRAVDSAIGVICALLCAVLLISFLAFLLKLITPYISDMPQFLSEETIYNSYIFKHFFNGNIFYAVTSII